MNHVYVTCPEYENDEYKLRSVAQADCSDLLLVYSDRKAVPFFNSDNCHGDDFYYTTMECMRMAIEYWEREYNRQGFVRWSILNKRKNTVIGTIELFHRVAGDRFNHCGVLRLDLRSDYEQEDCIISIISLILEPAFELFDCDRLITKAIPDAAERRKALGKLNFEAVDDVLIGHDGTEYGHYFMIDKMKR